MQLEQDVWATAMSGFKGYKCRPTGRVHRNAMRDMYRARTYRPSSKCNCLPDRCWASRVGIGAHSWPHGSIHRPASGMPAVVCLQPSTSWPLAGHIKCQGCSQLLGLGQASNACTLHSVDCPSHSAGPCIVACYVHSMRSHNWTLQRCHITIHSVNFTLHMRAAKQLNTSPSSTPLWLRYRRRASAERM